MRSSVKKIVIAAGIAGAAAIGYGLYTWNKPHRNVQKESAIPVTAQAIFDAYSKNEQEANNLYLDKAVLVTGEVVKLQTNQEGKMVVVLKTSDPMFGIQGTLKAEASITPGQTVSLKGICTGYLMDVVLIDCYLVNPS